MEARIDHIVVWVKDANASAGFYQNVVGLAGVRTEEFRAGKVPFPSVRVCDDAIIDLTPVAAAPATEGLTKTPGSAGHPVNHVCLAMSRDEFNALAGRLAEHGVDTSARLTQTFGARGIGPEAFYFRDPDGNVIEARYYE